MCAAKSLCKAKSRLPLWGALVPSGHRSALDRAGRRECPPVEGGEGNPLAFPHSPCEGPLATCPLSHGCRRASSPKGGAKYVRYQKLAQSQASPPPLGEVSCLRHDGEGSGKPPSRCATGREKRFAVSLASLWLPPHKVKAVGLWSHLPVRSAQGVCHRQTAPYNPQPFEKG